MLGRYHNRTEAGRRLARALPAYGSRGTWGRRKTAQTTVIYSVMEDSMPERETIERAREDAREGKSPSTQAGEFVREEIHHVREGKHGARSPEQAIAIGLSKARRAGVKVPRKKGGSARSASRTAKKRNKPSAKRSRAVRGALKREGRSAGTKKALGRHARKAARSRTAASRSASAKKAARTKGPARRKAAARKAARTRARRG